MKNENSVHLDGLVESCRFLGDIPERKLTVAKLSIVTLHPNSPSRLGSSPTPSEQFDRIHHLVRVVADADLLSELQSLSRELNLERASGKPELSQLHPCSIDGHLCTVDGETFVEANPGGFTFTEKVGTTLNNVAKVSGNVVSVSFTDESARVNLGLGPVVVSSFFSKESNRSGWDAVASGKLKRGDVVSMSGPLISSEFSNGLKKIRTYFLNPHVIQKQKLVKRRTAGPEL